MRLWLITAEIAASATAMSIAAWLRYSSARLSHDTREAHLARQLAMGRFFFPFAAVLFLLLTVYGVVQQLRAPQPDAPVPLSWVIGGGVAVALAAGWAYAEVRRYQKRPMPRKWW